jgi:hypothetical protein
MRREERRGREITRGAQNYFKMNVTSLNIVYEAVTSKFVFFTFSAVRYIAYAQRFVKYN